MGVPHGFPSRGLAAVKKQPALQYSRCRLLFFGFAANPSPLPWERVRVRASSGGTNFCSERRRVLPSPTGRGSGFAVAGRGLPVFEYSRCRQLFEMGSRQAWVWRRNVMNTVRIRKFIVLKKQMKKQPALRFPQCRLLFCDRYGYAAVITCSEFVPPLSRMCVPLVMMY